MTIRTAEALTEITVREAAKEEQKLTNQMTAKYRLYGRGSSDKTTIIRAKAIENNSIETEIYSRAARTSDKATEITSIYRGNSDMLTVVQPRVSSNILTSIEVRPNARMAAVYEVKKPPLKEDSYFPIQDAFTKKEEGFQTINYGQSSSMVIGNNDEFESFIRFTTKFLDESYVITDILMEIPYYKEVTEGYKIEVHEATAGWGQDTITYLNRPQKGKLFTNKYEVDQDKGKIIFNLTEEAEKWFRTEEENYGVVISTPEIESLSLRTSESHSTPRLIVRYYDTKVPSAGKSQIKTEIFVYSANSSDMRSEIEVKSDFGFSYVPTEIYVHQKDVPLHEDLSTIITSSRPDVLTSISAARRDKSEQATEVIARSEKIIKDKVSSVYVSRSSIATEVTAKSLSINEVNTVITVGSKTNKGYAFIL